MGMSIIGGLVFSTLITLFVAPILFVYIDRFREFIEGRVGKSRQEQPRIPETDAATRFFPTWYV